MMSIRPKDPGSAPALAGSRPVSWTAAWRRGLAVMLNHGVLLLLVALAVVCERLAVFAISFHPALQAGWTDWLRRMSVLVTQPDPPQVRELLGSFPPTLLITAGLMLVGMLILIGIMTLIRDLLLSGGYESRRVMAQGGRFFWPVLSYKLPIYLAGSVFSLSVALALWELWQAGQARSIGLAAGLAVGWLIAFGIARVFLSLGSKVIVTESPPRLSAVYRRVWRIIRPALVAVTLFYLTLVVLSVLATLLSLGIAIAPIPAPVRVVAVITLLAATTLAMKAAAFDLYLQLAARSASGGSGRG